MGAKFGFGDDDLVAGGLETAGDLLAPIGYVPPAEHEATYYRGQSAPAELAVLT